MGRLLDRFVDFNTYQYTTEVSIMSATCLAIIHQPSDIAQLKTELILYVINMKCGINFCIHDAFLELQDVVIGEQDVGFELFDLAGSNDLGLFMCLDGYKINGIEPSLPLAKRLEILQGAIERCLRYTSTVEVFLSDDHPTMEDYAEFTIKASQTAEILEAEYRKAPQYCCPDVHLWVTV